MRKKIVLTIAARLQTIPAASLLNLERVRRP
jgi:hypothetical protein